MLTAERGAAFGLRIALLLVPPIHDMLAAALTRSALMAVEALSAVEVLPRYKRIPLLKSLCGGVPPIPPLVVRFFFLSFFLAACRSPFSSFARV